MSLSDNDEITGMKSINTLKAKKVAIINFTEFLRLKFKKESVEACGEFFLCREVIFDNYAAWLLLYKRTNKRGELVTIKSGSAVNYLSGVKETIKKMYPLNALWKQSEWYTKIRSCLEIQVNKIRMNSGLSCSDKAYPLSRKHVMEICKYLYQQNDVKLLKFHLQLVFNRQAIGRANEIMNTRLDSMFFDDTTSCITVDWNQLKTGVQDLMSFVPDKECFELCPLQAFACYLIMSDSCPYIVKDTDTKFLFGKNTNSSEVTEKLHVLRKDIECLSRVNEEKSINATSLRIGSTNECANDISLTSYDIIARGGWDLTFLSTYFEYLLYPEIVVVRAGRALAGWPNSRIMVYSPSLTLLYSTLQADDLRAAELIKQTLFHKVCSILNKEVIDVLFAAILKNYNDCVIKYPNNPVYKEVRKVSNEHQIETSKLVQWSTIVQNDFKTKNAVAMEVSSAPVDSQLFSLLISLNNQINDLKATNARLENALTLVLPLVQELKNEILLMKRASRSFSPNNDTPSKKRQRAERLEEQQLVENMEIEEEPAKLQQNYTHQFNMENLRMSLMEFWLNYHRYLCHRFPINFVPMNSKVRSVAMNCLTVMAGKLTDEESEEFLQLKKEYKQFENYEKFKNQLENIAAQLQERVMKHILNNELANISKEYDMMSDDNPDKKNKETALTSHEEKAKNYKITLNSFEERTRSVNKRSKQLATASKGNVSIATTFLNIFKKK